MFDGFYKGKRVLVTGHTGFKGSWLSLWLHSLGASVSGLGLKPPTNLNFYETLPQGCFHAEFECDIRDYPKTAAAIKQAAPDVLFHLAAQPLVRHSYAQPLETFETNAVGTANVLEAVRRAELPSHIVVVTSDKCYENRGWEFAYRENDSLGGHDAYSSSKAAAELVTQSWRQSFFLPNPKLGNIASARAGNVIGGGDYAADRIIPDCVRALMEKRPIVVRNPDATRAWQHVLDCLSGYLVLGAAIARADKTSALNSAFNFGPGPRSNLPVSRLVTEILNHWPGQWQHVGQANAPHEAHLLSLTIDKAASALDWHPTWDFEIAVAHTMAWYYQRHTASHKNIAALSIQQIESFCETARNRSSP